MNARMLGRLFASVFVCVVICEVASGELIYRETYGRPADTGDLSVNDFDWGDFNSTAQFYTASPPTSSGINGSQNGRPIDVANVNAGPNSDGTTGALPRGLHFILADFGAPMLTFTSEYPFDPADYLDFAFSWYEGNADATATMRLAIQQGGNWYAHSSALTTSSITLGGFAANAVLQTVPYTSTAADWLVLNFDGSYTGDSNGTSGTVLSLGGTPGADLSGMITAFGLYVAGPGTRRFDTFAIDGNPVPEPASAVLLLGAVAAAACVVGTRSHVGRRKVWAK